MTCWTSDVEQILRFAKLSVMYMIAITMRLPGWWMRLLALVLRGLLRIRCTCLAENVHWLARSGTRGNPGYNIKTVDISTPIAFVDESKPVGKRPW